MLRIHSKAIRTIVRWQIVGTAIATAVGAMWLGVHGAMSLALGGGIGIVAALAFDFTAWRSRKAAAPSAGEVMFNALRAEGVKIGVMVALLWLVFALYKDVVKIAFIASFVASTIALSMAFFANDE